MVPANKKSEGGRYEKCQAFLFELQFLIAVSDNVPIVSPSLLGVNSRAPLLYCKAVFRTQG